MECMGPSPLIYPVGMKVNVSLDAFMVFQGRCQFTNQQYFELHRGQCHIIVSVQLLDGSDLLVDKFFNRCWGVRLQHAYTAFVTGSLQRPRCESNEDVLAHRVSFLERVE